MRSEWATSDADAVVALTRDGELICELTVHNGLAVYDLNGITREDWNKLGNYGSQGDRRWDGTLTETVRRRDSPKR